jgi:hypothetical protein
MIFILNPTKDTYITNLQTQFNDGSLANFGKAATIDLFKLYNENKYSKSWAAFKFNGAFSQGDNITFIDSDNNTVTFIIDNTDNTDSTALNLDTGKVIIGTSDITDHNDSDPKNYSQRIADVINNVTSANNGLTLNITAYGNSNNELVLKQNKPGESGDTAFTIPTAMEHVGTSVTGTTITKFSRIDYSAALLKFDISSFKSKYVSNSNNDFSSSVYNDSNKFKAEIILKDVTTGLSKPKNYTLTVYPLLKDFDEGMGKDTIHFSDKGSSNFVSSSLKTDGTYDTWKIPGYISLLDDVRNTDSSNSLNFKEGNEDIVFDVTSYVKKLINDTDVGDNGDDDGVSILDDKGFIVTFNNQYLYNLTSYFVKRSGSRHLLNKKFIPQLRIIIDDSSYHIPQNPKNKKRYLNNEEIFYLFNRVNGKLKDFSPPTAGSDNIKFKIGSLFDSISDTSNVTNFKGEIISGIKKKTLSSTDLSRFNSNISSHLLASGSYKDALTWYWEDSDTTIVEAGSFVIGKKYKIRNYAAGQNDFTTIGALNNNVGTVFTATGAGSGAGDAFEVVEYNILSASIEFLAGETLNEINYRNVNVAIRIEDNKLVSDDNIQTIEVFFIDNFKQYDVVKVPYDLPSDNIGTVYYKVLDVDTDEVLIDYNDIGTKLFFDGEKYIFDLFIPKIFKNKRVIFEFKTFDNITGVKKLIKSINKIFRIE